MSPSTLSREELYELVWAQPVSQLARRFGLSDVGFAKLCTRCGVPRPPRGYWAKFRAGKRTRRTPLPKRVEPCETIVCTQEENDAGVSAPAEIESARSPTQEEQIAVAASLRGAHRLVSSAREQFEAAKQDESGILVVSESPALSLAVSKSQLRRALLLSDALLKAAEARGYEVVVGPKLTIHGQAVSFGIKEALATVKVRPQEHDLSGPYEFGHSRFLKRQAPTGNLTLFIGEAAEYWARGCRKQWRDGRKRLEDLLNRALAGLIDFAAHKSEHVRETNRRRQAEIEENRRRREAAERRSALKAEQDAERGRLNELLRQAESLRRSREIRDLVDAIRQVNAGDESRISDWVAWALMHADRLDPTVASPPCVLDESLPEESERCRW